MPGTSALFNTDHSRKNVNSIKFTEINDDESWTGLL